MFKKKLLLISIVVLLFLPSIAFAINVPGWPLVPCGLSQDNPATTIVESKPCGRCDLFQLLKNLIDFIIGGLMPPMAVLLFVWAGFLILLSGASPSLYAKGQEIFKNTFYGIIILLSAWMITNTLILSIGARYNNARNWWQFTCTEPPPVSPPVVTPPQRYSCNQNSQCIADSNGQYTTPTCNGLCQSPPVGTLSIITSDLPNGVVGQSYSQTIGISGGQTPYAWTVTGSLPTGLNFNTFTGVIFGTPTAVGTLTFTVEVTDSSTPQQSATKQLSIVVGQSMATNCGSMALVCSNTARSCPSLATDPRLPSGRSSWTYLIPDVAAAHSIPGVNTSKFLESIMRIETNGVMNKQSGSDPPSCGLMQVQAGVANVFRNRCGVTHDISCEWLKGNALQQGESYETVARASICIAAEYVRSTVNSSCYEGQVRDLAAGYNGGDGCNQNNNKDNALAQSRSCSSATTVEPQYDTDCSNRPTLRYECLWDDYAHTTCNTGFSETRDYVAKFNACYFR